MSDDFTTRPELLGTFGMVATTHWLASATGMAVLERGGNAFDAAAATGFALQVVEPHLNGPGGDVPIMVAPAGGAIKVICGQGPAPGAATLAAYQALGLDIVPGTGQLPVVVPGAFGAWLALLRDYGTLALEDVLAPAIALARDGYPLVPNISLTIDALQETFRNDWPSSAEVYLPGDRVPAPGSLFRNPALAATYERILRTARRSGANRERQIEAAHEAWYQGFVAEAIDGFMRTAEVRDTTGRRHRGLLRGDDLARWRPGLEDPVSYDYHGITVCKTAAWGQGPVFLQQLALLAGFDLAALAPGEFVHTVIEASKLAFADREAFYGDPEHVEVPLETLLSDSYNERRRALIGEHCSLDLRPGAIPGFGGPVFERPRDPAAGADAAIGEPTVARFDDRPAEGDTCHLDIVDRFGNMVTATPSGGWLQSTPVVPGLGFGLSNRGQMFWLDAASPGCIAPYKRPRTTLSVTIALREGQPWMAFGTPGGDKQDQWALHLFLRKVHFGHNLQQAIDAPAFHTEHFPSSFYPREYVPGNLTLEGRFGKDLREDLRRRGHRLVIDDDWSIGRLSAVAREEGLLKGAANPRFMQGYAIGR